MSSKPKRFRMLRLAWRLFVLALFVGGWALAAAAMHVVVVPDQAGMSMPGSGGESFKVLVLPKNRLGYRDTYADTRDWTPAEAAGREALLSRLVEAGHGDRLAHVLRPSDRRQLDELLDRRREVLGYND